jgi:CRP/FNR family transcriptional regulator, nitrogen oxide reductase regulator
VESSLQKLWAGNEARDSASRTADLPPAELFRGLAPQEVHLVLAAARLRRYPAKSVIHRRADLAEHVLLLREGRARYFYETRNGKKLILHWLLPGYTFGLAGIVRQMPEYLVGVEAVQDSVVSVWDTRTFRGLARRLPQLVENALFITSFSFDWYIAAHAALCSQTAQERLSHILFEYATKAGRRVAGGIEVDATNQELADAANVTHYTTSRLISAWEKAGLLQKQRGKIMVCSPERLFQHAKETDRGG